MSNKGYLSRPLGRQQSGNLEVPLLPRRGTVRVEETFEFIAQTWPPWNTLEAPFRQFGRVACTVTSLRAVLEYLPRGKDIDLEC